MRLKGSKALVTGASSGIGKAIASRLLIEGAEVWGTSRDPEAARLLPGIQSARLDISCVKRIDADWHAQGLDTIDFDIGSVEASLAGPKLPQSQVPLSQAHLSAKDALGDRAAASDGPVRDGDVVIAAITSC